MPEVGSASLAIIPSFNGFQSNLESGTGKALTAAGVSGGGKYGAAAGKSAGSAFGTNFKKVVAGLGLAKLGIEAFQFAQSSIGSASDLNESLNAVNVTYGKQSKAVKKLGREAAESLGLSNNEFNGLSVRFSAFSKTIAGGDSKKIVSTLDDLTTRAADFASVMNLEVNDAAELFQSGLAGETEPLRRFGIDLSAAAVESFAYANGIAEAGDKLTESQKVQARYAYLMKQTAQTQGDFKNTSDQLANSQRILSAKWEDGKAKLGKGLLPIMTDAANFLLNKGIPAFEDFSDWFTKKGVPALRKFGGWVKDDLIPATKKAAEKMKPLIGAVKDLAGFLKDLPGPAKIAGIAAVLGGITYGKLRGGSGGALSTAGKVLGVTKPVPVFVTNPGLGGVGGPAGPTSKLGKVGAFASKAALPVAIVAASAVALKGLWDWNHGDDKNPVDTGLGGGKIGDWSRNFFGKDDAKEYEKNLGVVNNAWAKVGKTTDGAREKVVLYDGTVRKVPTLWKTVFETPGLLRDKALVEQYGSLLDGLPREVKIRFTTSVSNNNATGEGGGGTVPGRSPSGPGADTNGPGVKIDIHGDVRPNDSREFLSYLQRHARGSALDGVRSIP